MGIKKCVLIGMLLILSAFFSGCGNGGGPSLSQDKQTEDQTPADVLEEKWKISGEETTGNWKVTDYDSDCLAPPEEGLIQNEFLLCADGDQLYYMAQYFNEENPYEYFYCLNALNTVSMERAVLAFEPDHMENTSGLSDEELRELTENLRKGYARVSAMDVQDRRLYVFLTSWNEKWEVQHYYQMEIDMEGKLVRTLDLAEWVREEGEEKQFMVPYAICSAGEGLYLVDNEKKRIRLVDGSGEMIAEEELGGMNGGPIECVGKTGAGIPVFSMAFGGGIHFFIVEEGGARTLCDEALDIQISRLDALGNLLMVSGSKVKCWDVTGGTTEVLADLEGLHTTFCRGILRNSKDEILLLFNEKKEPFLYKISSGSDMERVQIRLLQVFSDSYTTQCAAEYSRQNPGIDIEVAQMEGNDETFLNRLAEEMKAGEGPDLLLIDRRQTDILMSADLLEPIGTMLSEELQEQIFDGVLEFGRYGDELYAIPCEASLETLLISQEQWQEDNWTLDEAIKLFREWNGESGTKKRFESIAYSITPDKLLYDLCVKNIEHSAFVDLENRKCNFDTENFYQLLEFCLELGEQQGGDSRLDAQEMAEEVREGKALTYSAAGGFKDYSYVREILGEEFHTVGYPSEKSDVCTIVCYRGLAVNARSQHKDVVCDFLQFLLSEESQVEYTTEWIRRDVLENHVKEHTNISDKPIFEMKNGYMDLGGREDGSSFLKEYVSLMDRGTPQSIQYDIQDIVLEEAGAFFAGDRTAQEAAEIIQKRVGLLLSE